MYENILDEVVAKHVADCTEIRERCLPFGKRIAHISASVKRAKRGFVARALAEYADSLSLDVTPTVAQHCMKRVLGRGVDGRALLEMFAIPGRTAAQKSAVSANDLVDFEQSIEPTLRNIHGRLAAARMGDRLVLYLVERGRINPKIIGDEAIEKAYVMAGMLASQGAEHWSAEDRRIFRDILRGIRAQLMADALNGGFSEEETAEHASVIEDIDIMDAF